MVLFLFLLFSRANGDNDTLKNCSELCKSKSQEDLNVAGDLGQRGKTLFLSYSSQPLAELVADDG